MDKELAESRLLNDIASRLIDLPAQQRFALRERRLHAGDPGIAGFGNYLENLLELIRDLFSNETGPGEIAVNRTRLVQLCPQIDQNEIAFADSSRRAGFRLVVRIATVRTDSDNRRVIADQPIGLEM